MVEREEAQLSDNGTWFLYTIVIIVLSHVRFESPAFTTLLNKWRNDLKVRPSSENECKTESEGMVGRHGRDCILWSYARQTEKWRRGQSELMGTFLSYTKETKNWTKKNLVFLCYFLDFNFGHDRILMYTCLQNDAFIVNMHFLFLFGSCFHVL